MVLRQLLTSSSDFLVKVVTLYNILPSVFSSPMVDAAIFGHPLWLIPIILNLGLQLVVS